MRRLYLVAAVTLLATGYSAPALAGTEDYVGEISYMAGPYCPENTFEADGRLLPVQQFQVLYAQIGNAYGGDFSKMNFALPDLRQSAAVMTGTNGPKLKACIAYNGNWPQRP